MDRLILSLIVIQDRLIGEDRVQTKHLTKETCSKGIIILYIAFYVVSLVWSCLLCICKSSSLLYQLPQKVGIVAHVAGYYR